MVSSKSFSPTSWPRLRPFSRVVPGDGCPVARRQSAAGPSVARNLANELDGLDRPFVLVLDDYHRIEPSSTRPRAFARLLEHPPPPCGCPHDPA